MSGDIRLLYFKSCPNVDEARLNLRTALAQAGWPEQWEETDLEKMECPEKWRGFPSPTVLIGGADIITGARLQPGTSSCRFGGAPSPEQIKSALSHRSWLSVLTAIPAAAVGLVPATFCPACIPALAGFIGALGLGVSADRILAPVTMVLLLVALAGLAYQCHRGGTYRPFAVGVLGAMAMYSGQFCFESTTLKGVGIAALVGASFWNVLPRIKLSGGRHCSACAHEGEKDRKA